MPGGGGYSPWIPQGVRMGGPHGHLEVKVGDVVGVQVLHPTQDLSQELDGLLL